MPTVKNEHFTPTIAQRARALLITPIAALSSPTLPRFKFYGGATITGAHDAQGSEYTLLCARDLTTGTFGLYGLSNDTPVLLAPVSGRGSVWVSLFDGMGYWKGWEGESKRGAPLPGFAAFPSIPSLDARIAALEAGAGGAPAPAHAVAIPPDGAIAALWPLAYGPSEVDTPEEVAVKFNKLKAAVFEMLMLMKQAGVLA